MFKTNKDTRKTQMALFWCLYCSSVSIVNFEQANVDWAMFVLSTVLDWFLYYVTT